MSENNVNKYAHIRILHDVGKYVHIYALIIP